MLKINENITIEDWELIENFVRSSGPGGQNVNKVSTAVELRFEALRSPNIPDQVKNVSAFGVGFFMIGLANRFTH